MYLQSEIYHSTEIPLRWDVSPYISSLLIRWRLRWLCLDKDTRFFYDKGFKIDLKIQKKFIISVGYPSTCFRIPIYSRNANLETVVKRCSGKIFTRKLLKFFEKNQWRTSSFIKLQAIFWNLLHQELHHVFFLVNCANSFRGTVLYNTWERLILLIIVWPWLQLLFS